MPLHRLRSVTVGVPDVPAVAAYYADFGLTPTRDGWLATVDGGEQLRLVTSPVRRLVSMTIGADDPDDIGRVSSRLARLGVPAPRDARRVSAVEPVTGVEVVVEVGDRVRQPDVAAPPYNTVGRVNRGNDRADVLGRVGQVRPRKLGHVVIGSPDQATSQRFFTAGIGLQVSDEVRGRSAFMRCSTDHHNVLVNQAPATFIHHTSWQVDDLDEIGRGATAMLADHPERHVWGLGRHHIGSNFFWYLRDPAGNFSEYYSDMDAVVDDALWHPGVFDEGQSLYSWGPPPPPSFLLPDDLAGLMSGAHSA